MKKHAGLFYCLCFFFNDTATTEIYTLSLHDALPIYISFDNMKRAVIHGSAMASFCVGKFGTEALIGLTREDVNSRVKEFADLVHFTPVS